ncbi:hypothetical protein H5410_045690 [Solanum commersonii]|uniref:Uncharacterized protein n=1 Tax=Solanum commersonii TaxID=4109 RepID=A0A9J5XEE2_SOLCO|nr:hypothetical protein H5410_045690 [Solanum commersonii]
MAKGPKIQNTSLSLTHKSSQINTKGLRDLIREDGLKMGMLDHLASWVELVDSFGGSPNVSISPLISSQTLMHCNFGGQTLAVKRNLLPPTCRNYLANPSASPI